MQWNTALAALILSGFASGTAQAAQYDRIKSGMASLIVDHPALVQSFELGPNDQGERILGVRIEAPGASGTRVSQLVVGAHHGNERLSADSAMSFARRIAAVFSDPGAAEYEALAGQVFYVVPVLNLGGFNRNSRFERNSAGRTVDPNRDYPDPCIQEKGNFQLKSTRLLADFLQRENIVAAVTIHGYIGTLTYPWGIYTTHTHTPDHAIYELIGRRAVQSNGYRAGTHTDLIYAAAGAFEDWAYHEHGIWVMLLELAYSPDHSRDAQALVTFFSLVPGERSGFHEHTGVCTKSLDKMLESRP